MTATQDTATQDTATQDTATQDTTTQDTSPGDTRELCCADPQLHAGARYLNRELSQVEFNARVVELARDEGRPLLERLKFVAISAGNQDEFFQKRLGGLYAQRGAGARSASADGMSPDDQLTALRKVCTALARQQSRIVEEELFPALARAGVRRAGWDELSGTDREAFTRRFVEQIFPILTPLAIDPGRPFPHISSLSLNLMVVLREPDGERRRFARVKVPGSLPRFLMLGDGNFMAVEDLIAAHLDRLFPGMEVIEHHLFRVTRNADIALETGEVDDLLETIEDRLLRRRFGQALRLELHPDMPEDVRDRLMTELRLTRAEVYELDGLLDPSGLWSLYAVGPDELKDEPWSPVTPPRLSDVRGSQIFSEIRQGDVLVHHPYESFSDSVAAFMDAAANDDKVVAIKLTIYRTSESESHMVDALIRAAESGKQAVALVELKARFDEKANIQRARQLEEAGVHVVYGFVGLKTHTKTLLVVREEEGTLRRYAHIGTGNYNPKTAKLYEDIGILTSDEHVGRDLSQLFNTLTGFSQHRAYERLLVAPKTLRGAMRDEIAAQTQADDPRITIKVNNLVDTEMVEALYDASQAGVRVDLVVRSQCTLRPGLEGISEGITVRSLVGDFLEHSRIYRFGTGADATYYVGSADLMGRNLDRRFEALVPVTADGPRRRLDRILDTLLADDELAWELRADGTWCKVPTVAHVNAHRTFREWALERSH